MKKEMLINVQQPEESRVAIVENGQLEELYLERTSRENLTGNIYKGRVVNIEPSIQAAFVDFGVGRNGFLHVSDVEYEYYKHLLDGDRKDRRPNERDTRSKPPIQQIFKRGSEVLVQVIKESFGTKGPTLSTYISIPGRYLVLMPALQRVGVSRKIEDDEVRRELRKMLLELNPPQGLGFIIRTAGAGRTRKDLQRDLNYLLRLWRAICKRVETEPAPVVIYEESDIIIRTIRDIFAPDIDTIWIDEPEAYERAREFVKLVMPRYVHRFKLYEGKEPLFNRYGIEEEIERIHRRTVPLKGGGSIVIDQTEALVAIDVNSGNFRVDDDAEETAYQVNLAAAGEIARQLRLRDLGGVIVIDFIDMRQERHRRSVERTLRDHLRRDRARTKLTRISPFGLVEMTRQRIRPSLRRSVFEECPCCNGGGYVKSAESVTIDVMRSLMSRVHHDDVARVEVSVHLRVADYISNKKRRELQRIEDETGTSIIIHTRSDVRPDFYEIQCFDIDGRPVHVGQLAGSK